MRETSVEEITDEVRGFARSRPGVFLGSAALVGFLGTRFLKSSSQGAGSAGYGSGTATSGATVTHGTGEPATTALPPGSVAGSPTTTTTTTTTRRTPPPVGGQPLSEEGPPSAQPPRGF